jgi:hypothetical protein
MQTGGGSPPAVVAGLDQVAVAGCKFAVLLPFEGPSLLEVLFGLAFVLLHVSSLHNLTATYLYMLPRWVKASGMPKLQAS